MTQRKFDGILNNLNAVMNKPAVMLKGNTVDASPIATKEAMRLQCKSFDFEVSDGGRTLKFFDNKDDSIPVFKIENVQQVRKSSRKTYGVVPGSGYGQITTIVIDGYELKFVA